MWHRTVLTPYCRSYILWLGKHLVMMICRRLEHTALTSGFLLLRLKRFSILRSVGSTQLRQFLRPFGDHKLIMFWKVVFVLTISTQLCISTVSKFDLKPLQSLAWTLDVATSTQAYNR